MGIISVAGASGRKYPINIAGDVPDEIERGRIQQYVAAQEQAFAQEYTAKTGKELQVDDGTAIGRGWERGMASAKTRLGTTQRIIGEQTGLDFLKNYGVDVEEQGRYEQLLAQLSQPTPLEYTDVKGLGSGFTFVGEQIGQTAPETGAIMGATLLGTIGGTAATGNPVAGTALGITAGALTASPTIFGGHVQRQEEEVKAGRKDKVDLTDALAATVGSATVEAIADRFLILGLIKPGQKIFSRTIGGLIEGAAVEAPTEILQQVLERAQAGLPLTDDAAMQEYITSGISGAVVGSSIRGPLAMAGIGTGAQPTPSTTPTTPAVNPPALAGPIAPVTQLGVTAQEPRQEDFPSTAQGIIDFNAALGQYYAGIAATTLTPEAQAAADAVAGAAPKIDATAQKLGEPFTYTTIDGKKTLVAPTFESLKQALGLNPKQYYSVNELKAAALAKGFDAPSAYLSGVEVYKRLSAKLSSATPTVEDANVGKPTVTTGSKSGTTATKPGVGNGIGLDATQGAAKLETPAAPGLGATVSDTSTDNVPEGSQSAALKALIEEMRAATSGDINAAIPKNLAKRALDAGLIKEEDMGMALIARVAMKDAVDAYDAQPAPEQTTAAPIEEAKIAAEADPANKTAPGNEEFDFDFDEGFEALDAARRAEKVAAERKAAVKLQGAPVPERAPMAEAIGLDDVNKLIDSGRALISKQPISPLMRKVLSKRDFHADEIRPLFNEDQDYVIAYFTEKAGISLDPPGSLAKAMPKLDSLKQEIFTRTQDLLSSFPDVMTVYRIGRLDRAGMDNPVSFTLNPKYKANLNLPWVQNAGFIGSQDLVPYTVNKSDIIASGDLGPRTFDEHEVLIRPTSVEPISQLAPEQTTAAPSIEEVAADLDAKVAAQAAAELKDAQLPSIDGEVPDTVKGLGDARAAADARAKGYEQNINRITAESEQARANKLAADEAQAAQIAAERTQQYGKGDLPLSRVPAEYTPRTGALGMGKEVPPQVIPAAITVSQAPITPEKQVEPVTEKLWKEMGFSRTDSKLFSNIVNGVEQGLKGKPVNDPQVRSKLSNYAYSSEKPNPQQIKVGEWLQKNKVRMQGAPDVRSSAGQAMISQIEATSRGKLDAANLAAQREKDALFNPEFAQLSVEDPYLNDVSTPSDKQKATAVAYRKFEGIKPEGTVTYRLVRTDKKTGKITEIFKSSKMLPDTAAGKYFERYKRVVDALDAIASDYNGDIIAQAVDKEGPAIDNKFYAGLGKDSAFAARAWVDANMSEAVQKQLSSRISKMSGSYLAAPDAVAIDLKTIYEGNVPLRENAKASAAANFAQDDAIGNAVSSQRVTVVGLGKKIERIPVPEGDPFAALFASANKNKENLRKSLDENVIVNPAITGILLPSNAVLDLEGNMHPAVNGGLLTNNLAQALRALGRTGRNSAIRRISTRFSRLVGNTQVQVVEALRGQDGTAAAGVFDPSTNTIYLDSVTGLNPHVVIHEMSHALTSAELANPQSPLRQRVSELFNKALPYMGSIQGSANLDEFAAESMSNHMFREEMARIHPNGNPMSTWQLFSNSVKNFLRRLIGLDPKAYGMLSEIDQVLDAILAPAPQFRDAGQLYMNSTGNGVSSVYKGVHKVLTYAPGSMQNNASLVGGLATAFRALTEIPRKILIGLTPVPSLVDVAKRYGLGEEATNLIDSINQHDAENKTDFSKIDAANEGLQSWKKANPEAADTLSRIENEATDNGVDPTDTDASNYDSYWMSYDRLDANGDIITTTRIKFNTPAERNAGIEAHNTNRQFALQTEARKSGDKNDAQVAKYTQLRAELNAIRDTGAITATDIFVQKRDTYKILYEKLRKAIYAKIDASFRSADGTMTTEQKAAARKLKNEVYARVFDENLKRPYFPFSREGNFWVRFTTKNSNGQPDEVIMAFGNESQRDAFIAGIPAIGEIYDKINKTTHTINKKRNEAGVIQKDPKTGEELYDVEVFLKDTKSAFKNAPSTSFMRQALKLMNDGNVSADVQADFVELFLSVLPESAVAKAFQKRQGIEGYQSDQFAAFENKAYSLARYGTNVEWGQTIREASNKLEAKKTNGMDAGLDAVVDGLLSSAEYTLAYRKDGIMEQAASNVNRVAFTSTVGLLNPSSALVNTSSIALVVGPYLSAKHGWTATTTAISRAVKMFSASGMSREQDMFVGLAGQKTRKLKAMPSYMNYYTRSPSGELVLRNDLNLSPSKRAYLDSKKYVMAVGEVNGFFSRSLMHDSLGLEGRIKGKNGWDTANVISASAFQLVERMTREVSLIATYDLELAKLANNTSMTEQQKQVVAAKEAMDVVMKTSGGSIRAMSPKYFRKHIGRIAGMFKTYGMTQAYLQFSLLRDVLVKSDLSPRDRKLAAKRFAAIHLSSWFLAGVAGTPFFGAAAMMWDAFFTDDDEDDAETITRKYIGEIAYKGFPTELMGIDVSSRIGLNLKDLLFQLGRYNVDMSDEEIVVQVLGGPAWGTFKNFRRGMTEMLDPAGDPQRAIEAMAPASIRNALKAYRYGTEGAKTRRGDPIVDDITGGMLLGQAMGFAPTEYTFAQEKAAHVKGMDDAIRTKRSKLMKRYWIAYRQGDFETVGEIQQEIDEFNARHAGRPKVWIEPRDIQASAKTNERTNARAYNGVILSAATADDMRANAEEFGQGFRLFDK
jgi:hypothetical protein